jgi:DNA-directed RNA polymerases I, II, and III subunit RPABC2
MDDDEYNIADEEIDEEGSIDVNNKPVRKLDVDDDFDDDDANEDNDDDDDELDDDIDDENDDEASEINEQDVLRRLQATNDTMDFEESDDENENMYEDYLRKFAESTRTNIISEFHPELQSHNNDEIENMCVIVRDGNEIPIDPLHKTLPILTRYEKARALGERSKQINSGAKPFVKVDETIIDGYLIALKELEEKKLPFIIKRPLPNGGCEYWKLSDLEVLI